MREYAEMSPEDLAFETDFRLRMTAHDQLVSAIGNLLDGRTEPVLVALDGRSRSEERRVGKECRL